MHRSGNNVVKVRVAEREPERYLGDLLFVSDDAPWVDLGFLHQPPNDICRRIGLIKCSDPPDDELTWSRWELWGNDGQKRRRGLFATHGVSYIVPEVRVYLDVIEIFSAEQHQKMVDDISRVMLGATWDLKSPASGVWIRKVFGREPVYQLAYTLPQELRDAESVLRAPALELAPTSPMSFKDAILPGLTYTSDLPENNLVGWWAAARLRHIALAIQEIELEVRQYQARAQTTLSEVRQSEIEEHLRSLRGLLEQFRVMRSRVSTKARQELPRWQDVGPAMTRDPRRRRLLEALRAPAEEALLGDGSVLSRYREKTVSALFELWGALALVEALIVQGWALLERPKIESVKAMRPERIWWHLYHGEEAVSIGFEPHAGQPSLAPQSVEGPLMTRMQRAAVTGTNDGEPGLICSGAAASPDYILLYSRKGELLALAIGDALCSDYKWAKMSKFSSVVKKIEKVARYAREISWCGKGFLINPSGAACFVLLPGMASEWLLETRVSDVAEGQDVRVLGATPSGAGEFTTQVSGPLWQAIINTLRAHASDGSNRFPIQPGRVVGVPPAGSMDLS